MRAVLAALLLCPAIALAQPVSARDVLDAQAVLPTFVPRSDGYYIKCPSHYQPVLTALGFLQCNRDPRKK